MADEICLSSEIKLNPLSLEKAEEEKVQEGIPTPIHPFKTRYNPIIEPFYTKPNLETKTLSPFGNMAGEEEERVLNEPRVEDE